MLVQEPLHELRLVGGQVVEDHVDLLVGCAGRDHLAEETHEVQARVTGRRLSLHLARPHVQRRVERQRAVPLVLEPVTLDPARRERQHAVLPVEGLNGGLLVDAEHRGVTGRIQVETDDVGGLRLEVGVVRRHVAGQPVRPQVGLAPNTLDDVLADTEMGGEAATGGSPETGVGGCGAYRKALASLGTRSPRARSAAAVNPLRGSSATLRPSG